MTQLKNQTKIQFFACTPEKAKEQVRQQRACDWWIYDWPITDYAWLFSQDKYSPLARKYYNDVLNSLNTAIDQRLAECENSRYAQHQDSTGLTLRISSRLAGRQAGNASKRAGKNSSLRVKFSANAAPQPQSCPNVPRELFTEPVGFGGVLHGPGGGNFRWEWRDQQAVVPTPTFPLYNIPIRFTGSLNQTQFLGSLHLVIDRVADLWVMFKDRPIPASVADRVDPAQGLSYRVSTGVGYFGIAAVIEVTHLESGQIAYRSVHGSNYPPGQLTPYNWWPNGWEQMSMDANGIIRHYGVDLLDWLYTIVPSGMGLPAYGTYRMRYILLAYGYQTLERQVISNVLGQDTVMGGPISLSHMPSLVSYTPGMTDGLIPPFEIDYTVGALLWPLDGTGILFDAVFDMKHLTTFRFVIKVGNPFDFAVGLVVQAAGWQTWVHLAPGETKYLAGAVAISGMVATWDAYPLHPQSPNYGWQRSWGINEISMQNGQCLVNFYLFLTAPDNPETTPANMPALKATQRWYWDMAGWGPQHEPVWGAIKKFAPDGRYDYEYAIQQYNLYVVEIVHINRSISQPGYQPLIDPATYFVTGYQTSTDYSHSPWHKRPWPIYVYSGIQDVPVMINGEQRIWNDNSLQYDWVPVEAVSISLTRAMQQQVAATLGITEYVVMDGDDIRWFIPDSTGAFSNVLWIDRFYTQGGTLIDDAAMRAAFQTVINNNAASWPNYRNIVIHPSVRFGSFLDNGGFEAGDYLLNQNGNMIEVSGFADLGSVSTRFLYYIRPEFR